MNRLGQIAIGIVALMALLAVGPGPVYPGQVSAQAQSQEHHAGLVIQYPGGSTQTYCLAFTGDTISGLDLLLKTGLDVKIEAYSGMGAEVCQIGATGCSYPDQPCACQSYGPGGAYWSYHHLQSGRWVSSATGASSHQVHDGDVDGWAWTGGQGPSAVYTFSQVCGVRSTASPSPVPPKPSPTRTPTPRRTATPLPRPTRPAPTATPTRRPVAAFTVRPALAPASTATPMLIATATTRPSPSATETPSATPRPTPTPSPVEGTATPSPTAIPPSSPPNQDNSQVRLVGILLGLASAAAFVLWRSAAAVRSRSAPPGGDDVE